MYLSWTLSDLIFRNRNYQMQMSGAKKLSILTSNPRLNGFLSPPGYQMLTYSARPCSLNLSEHIGVKKVDVMSSLIEILTKVQKCYTKPFAVKTKKVMLSKKLLKDA